MRVKMYKAHFITWTDDFPQKQELNSEYPASNLDEAREILMNGNPSNLHIDLISLEYSHDEDID